MDDLIREFLVESAENLERADRDMVALEADPARLDLLSGVFRTFHTIKGACGFLGFDGLGALAHNAESLLGMLRDTDVPLSQEAVTAILQAIDQIRRFLAGVGEDGRPGVPIDAGLVGELGRMAKQKRRGGAAARARAGPAADPFEGQGPAGRTLRIDVSLVDELMGLVGELVLARNRLSRCTAGLQDAELIRTAQRLGHVTAKLQEGIMKTRLQPVSAAWGKVSRAVRDVAVLCEKQVNVHFEGHETELDTTVVEAIKDPLLHLVRNAVDHGIEGAEERRALGKPEAGTLRLRAFHEGGQVNIEVSDDGRGIDLARVAELAVERGLLTEEQLGRMSEQDVANLIFVPGFSTARSVSSVSGRGVGMDVVKTNIESIGGAVEVTTSRGRGTRARIKIPLTLAIVPAIVVESASVRIAIPQVHLREIVCSEGGLERLHGATVYRLRGHLLPVVFLGELLGGSRWTGDERRIGRSQADAQLLVLDADGASFGVVVDAIGDPEEIVVKPLPPQLKGIAVFAGTSIMGNGEIAFILDVLGLAQRARITAALDRRPFAEKPPADAAPAQIFVLVEAGGRQVAVPLAAVERLESIPAAAVQESCSGRVVRYAGGLLPLRSLAACLHLPEGAGPRESARVLVCRAGGRRVGLEVGAIRDVVRQDLVLHERSTVAGVVGTTLVHDTVTDVLDVEALLGVEAG